MSECVGSMESLMESHLCLFACYTVVVVFLFQGEKVRAFCIESHVILARFSGFSHTIFMRFHLVTR